MNLDEPKKAIGLTGLRLANSNFSPINSGTPNATLISAKVSSCSTVVISCVPKSTTTSSLSNVSKNSRTVCGAVSPGRKAKPTISNNADNLEANEPSKLKRTASISTPISPPGSILRPSAENSGNQNPSRIPNVTLPNDPLWTSSVH